MREGHAYQRLLLVEGRDDREVLRHLCNHYEVPRDRYRVEYQEDGGIDVLLQELPTILKTEPPYLGIILDADNAPVRRWHVIRNILLREGYSDAPTALSSEGVIVTKAQSRAGVWLMPSNLLPGMLEDFAKNIKWAGDDLWEAAEASVDGIPRDKRPFCAVCPSRTQAECASCSHKMKAYIHTWLAWQQEPGTPLGLAITRKYFDAEAELARRLMRWLFDVFDFPVQESEADESAFRYRAEQMDG